MTTKQLGIIVLLVFTAGYLIGLGSRELTAQAGPEAEPGPAPVCVPGDVNGDEALNLSDPVHLLAHLFQGGPAPLPCASDELSAVFFVRHGDRDRNPGPDECPEECPESCINPEGELRAIRLSEAVRDLPLDYLLASELCRTQQTIEPTAMATGLDVEILSDVELVANWVLERPQGSTTLVVHHSFTIHNILELMGLGDEVRDFRISGDAYDTMYCVFIAPGFPPSFRVLHY